MNKTIIICATSCENINASSPVGKHTALQKNYFCLNNSNQYNRKLLQFFLFFIRKVSSLPCTHRSPKIVGGSEAEKSELPFIVSLMRRGGHFCGASILNDRWLVTAGHCVCNGLNKIYQTSQIQGVIGLHSISQYLNGNSAEKSTPVRVNFKSIIPYPKYECTNVKHDIGMLKFFVFNLLVNINHESSLLIQLYFSWMNL